MAGAATNGANDTFLTERGFRLLRVMFKMMLRKPRALRGKLAQWNAVVLLLALLVLGVAVYELVTYQMISDLDGRLYTESAHLESTASQYQSSGAPADLAFFEQLARSKPVNEFTAAPIYIKIFDKNSGRLLAVSPTLSQVLVPLKHADFLAALQGKQVLDVLHTADGNEVYALTFPLYDKVHRLIAVGQVTQSPQVVKQVQAILIVVLGIGGLITVIIAYAVSFWLTTRELSPLSTLIDTMHHISVGGLQTRLHPQKALKEIQLLTEAFNQMLSRLEASFALQQKFVADVSHELRTPLTAIQGHIDVLLLETERDGIHTDLEQISAELRRLSRLVANLLTTARAEAGMLPQPFAEGVHYVQLDSLLIEVARQAHFLNQQEKIEIGQLEQVAVPGDVDMLKQVLLNLVANAITYTPPTGRVTLSLTRASDPPASIQDEAKSGQEDWAVLSVCDTGPGIPAEDIPYIFDRHYRSRSTEKFGEQRAGLGLTIARLITEAHHGHITVESEVGKGTCFKVWLPTAMKTAGSQG